MGRDGDGAVAAARHWRRMDRRGIRTVLRLARRARTAWRSGAVEDPGARLLRSRSHRAVGRDVGARQRPRCRDAPDDLQQGRLRCVHVAATARRRGVRQRGAPVSRSVPLSQRDRSGRTDRLRSRVAAGPGAVLRRLGERQRVDRSRPRPPGRRRRGAQSSHRTGARAARTVELRPRCGAGQADHLRRRHCLARRRRASGRRPAGERRRHVPQQQRAAAARQPAVRGEFDARRSDDRHRGTLCVGAGNHRRTGARRQQRGARMGDRSRPHGAAGMERRRHARARRRERARRQAHAAVPERHRRQPPLGRPRRHRHRDRRRDDRRARFSPREHCRRRSDASRRAPARAHRVPKPRRRVAPSPTPSGGIRR